MGQLFDGTKSFPAAKIIIAAEIEGEKDESGIVTPFRRCTVICTNGGIYDVNCIAFTATEDRVRALWDTKPETFTKREFGTPYATGSEK